MRGWYREFASHATIRELKESNFVVDIWGDTAVASYWFEIDYEMEGVNPSTSERVRETDRRCCMAE